MTDPTWLPELREIVLERLRAQYQLRVTRELLETANVEARRHMLTDIADTLIVSMSAHVLADRLPPETVTESRTFRVEVPSSGWQQWKADHAAHLPAWFLRRWPVRYREHVFVGEVTVNLDRFWTFPESTIRLPELGKPVRLVQWDTQARWTEEDSRG